MIVSRKTSTAVLEDSVKGTSLASIYVAYVLFIVKIVYVAVCILRTIFGVRGAVTLISTARPKAKPFCRLKPR